MRHTPRFAAITIVTLALGIGAATAAVSVAVSVLHNPLPVKDDARLLLITKRLLGDRTLIPFSYAELADWRGASRRFENIAGVQYDGAWRSPADFGDRVMTVTGTMVSGNFFEVLGAQPAAGRLLSTSDALAGAEAVAVIGHGLWRREFGGTPAVVGRLLRIEGRAVRIVGVAPAGFMFPDGADVWRPLDVAPDTLNEGWFNLIGRLQPGASRASA